MIGGGAAAAADDVHEAGLGELPEEAARVFRLLVVAAEGVRRTGVRWHETYVGAIRASSATYGRISFAPRSS